METSLHFYGLLLSLRSKVCHSRSSQVNSWIKCPILCSGNWAQSHCRRQSFLLLCTPRNLASTSYCKGCMGANVRDTFIWKEDTLQTDMQIKAISKEMWQTRVVLRLTHIVLSVSSAFYWPSLPWRYHLPNRWCLTQWSWGDNVLEIGNSYHLYSFSSAILRVERATILNLIYRVYHLSVGNTRKQTLS